MFEIEDKSFESRLINLFKKIKIKFRFMKLRCLLIQEKSLKLLISFKKPFMANFTKNKD